MHKIHPKLCARPKPKAGLNRPKLEDPTLGALQYINRDGGWWQGTTSISGSIARLDLQRGTNVPKNALKAAGEMLQWVQQHEPEIRSFAAKQLKAGKARSNLLKHVKGIPKLKDADLVKLFVPSMVVLWDDAAVLAFACDVLPDGDLFGAHRVEVRVEGKKPQSVFLREVDIEAMAQEILAAPIPAEAGEFENSAADQFLARAAEWGWFEFDPELRQMLTNAIEQTEKKMRSTSGECATYMGAVKRVLLRIAQDTENP